MQVEHRQHRGGIDPEPGRVRTRLRRMEEKLHDRIELVDRRAPLAVMAHLPAGAVVNVAANDQPLAAPLDVFGGRGSDHADGVGAGLERAEGQFDRRTVGVPGEHLHRCVGPAGGLRFRVLGHGIDRFGILPDPVGREAGQVHGQELFHERFGVIEGDHGDIALQFHAHMLHRVRIGQPFREAPGAGDRLPFDHARPARRAQLTGIQRRPGPFGNPLIHRGNAGHRHRAKKQTRAHADQPPHRCRLSLNVPEEKHRTHHPVFTER